MNVLTASERGALAISCASPLSAGVEPSFLQFALLKAKGFGDAHIQ